MWRDSAGRCWRRSDSCRRAFRMPCSWRSRAEMPWRSTSRRLPARCGIVPTPGTRPTSPHVDSRGPASSTSATCGSAASWCGPRPRSATHALRPGTTGRRGSRCRNGPCEYVSSAFEPAETRSEAEAGRVLRDIGPGDDLSRPDRNRAVRSVERGCHAVLGELRFRCGGKASGEVVLDAGQDLGLALDDDDLVQAIEMDRDVRVGLDLTHPTGRVAAADVD